jgi:hypothetical protein
MLDAGDVEEMVLVIVDDEPFHLRRVHAAVGLCHVQHGHPQIREDVPRHAIERQKTHQCNGYDHHQKSFVRFELSHEPVALFLSRDRRDRCDRTGHCPPVSGGMRLPAIARSAVASGVS